MLKQNQRLAGTQSEPVLEAAPQYVNLHHPSSSSLTFKMQPCQTGGATTLQNSIDSIKRLEQQNQQQSLEQSKGQLSKLVEESEHSPGKLSRDEKEEDFIGPNNMLTLSLGTAQLDASSLDMQNDSMNERLFSLFFYYSSFSDTQVDLLLKKQGWHKLLQNAKLEIEGLIPRETGDLLFYREAKAGVMLFSQFKNGILGLAQTLNPAGYAKNKKETTKIFMLTYLLPLQQFHLQKDQAAGNPISQHYLWTVKLSEVGRSLLNMAYPSLFDIYSRYFPLERINEERQGRAYSVQKLRKESFASLHRFLKDIKIVPFILSMKDIFYIVRHVEDICRMASNALSVSTIGPLSVREEVFYEIRDKYGKPVKANSGSHFTLQKFFRVLIKLTGITAMDGVKERTNYPDMAFGVLSMLRTIDTHMTTPNLRDTIKFGKGLLFPAPNKQESGPYKNPESLEESKIIVSKIDQSIVEEDLLAGLLQVFRYYAILTDPGAEVKAIKSIKLIRLMRDCELIRDEPSKQDLEYSFQSPTLLSKIKQTKKKSRDEWRIERKTLDLLIVQILKNKGRKDGRIDFQAFICILREIAKRKFPDEEKAFLFFVQQYVSPLAQAIDSAMKERSAAVMYALGLLQTQELVQFLTDVHPLFKHFFAAYASQDYMTFQDLILFSKQCALYPEFINHITLHQIFSTLAQVFYSSDQSMMEPGIHIDQCSFIETLAIAAIVKDSLSDKPPIDRIRKVLLKVWSSEGAKRLKAPIKNQQEVERILQDYDSHERLKNKKVRPNFDEIFS